MEYKMQNVSGFTIIVGRLTMLLEKGDYGILEHRGATGESEGRAEYQVTVGTGSTAYPRLEEWLLNQPIRIIGQLTTTAGGDMILKIEHIEPLSKTFRIPSYLPKWWEWDIPSEKYKRIVIQ